MKQAEKFKRPVIQIIDTRELIPVSVPKSEDKLCVAENIAEMTKLKTPLISIVLGEGGSGGALAIGVSDEIWMFENAIYSILSLKDLLQFYIRIHPWLRKQQHQCV